MIERLALDNFRSFGNRAEAPIAPITLVYGPNSAGKSSLVKSLLLMKQSVLESPSGSFRYDGPYVDLGGAKAVAHRHSNGRPIGLEVSIGTVHHQGVPWSVRLAFSMAVDTTGDDRITLNLEADHRNFSIAFKRTDRTKSYLRLADQNAVDAYYEVLRVLRGDSPELFETAPSEADHLLAFEIVSMLPGQVVGHFQGPRSSVVKPVTREERSADEHLWGSFITQVAAEFRRLMIGVSYLGPLRRPWSRVEAILPDGQLDGVGPTGENSVNLLHRHPDLLNRVNKSLDLLETGYALEIKTLRSGTDDGVADIVPEYLVPSLRHLQSGVSISPADAGFGLSQLLPLLVESELRRQSLICIEQPELHLHPRLQARVGSVLRKAVQGSNRNRYLIETHSEHLLLRLQGLIRNKLLDATSVVIVYVDNQEYDPDADRYFQSIKSEMYTLRLSEYGELIDPWPGGFFDERWDELTGKSWSDGNA